MANDQTETSNQTRSRMDGLSGIDSNMHSLITLIVGTIIVFTTLFILTISKQLRLRQREATMDDREAKSKSAIKTLEFQERIIHESQDSIGRINQLHVHEQSIRTGATETANSVNFSAEHIKRNQVGVDKTPESISVEPKMRS